MCRINTCMESKVVIMTESVCSRRVTIISTGQYKKLCFKNSVSNFFSSGLYYITEFAMA